MRICFIAENYPPTHGGVAKSTQRIAKNIITKGTEVFVICFDNSRPVSSEDYIQKYYDGNTLVYRIGPFFTKQKDLKLDSFSENKKAILRRRAFDTICKILDNEHFDCILSFYLLNAGYLAQLVGNHFKKPVIAGVRGNDIGRNIFNIEKFRVIEWVMERAMKIICVNNYLRDRLLLAFPEFKEKSMVIYNGFNSYQFINLNVSKEEIIEKFSWNIDDLIIVYIGYLREKKGALQLLDAFLLLHEKGITNIRLLIVGPKLKEMEFKIWGGKWDHLVNERLLGCTGEVEHEMVFKIAKIGDVIIMPSLDDGLANGLLEGMSLSLCPVVSEVFSEIIVNDKNGIVIEKNNSSAIAETLIDLQQSRLKVKALGKDAQKTITESFNPEFEAENYIKVFKECIDEYTRF